tara:strand:- start:84 stop:845 length:762 start_codon:yes stop_codon:yes gene_type:complete
VINENSDITLVVTSCGRFDLLKVTLQSFLKNNNTPIKRLILTEDSGDEAVHSAIPQELSENALVFVNKPQLGQLKSIDLAYSHVDTKYIFHCEDDWFFYRPGFLEESKMILEHDPSILQVRISKHDYQVNNLVELGAREIINGCAYYRNVGRWKGLSWNPGLRRLKDYKLLESYNSFQNKNDTFLDVESNLNEFYKDRRLEAVFLENYVVDHIGDGRHITMMGERKKKLKKRLKQYSKIFGLIALGYLLANWI